MKIRDAVFSSLLLGGLIELLWPAAATDVVLAFPPLATAGIIIAGAGLLSSLSGDRQKQKALNESITRRRIILQLLRDFPGLIESLLPQFRALGALSAGQVQESVGRGLAKRGLIGTGIGTQLQAGAEGAGELNALNQAINAAINLTTASQGALGGVAIPQSSGGTTGQTLLNIGGNLLAASPPGAPAVGGNSLFPISGGRAAAL